MIEALTGNRNQNNNKNNQNPFIRVYKICTLKKSVSTVKLMLSEMSVYEKATNLFHRRAKTNINSYIIC